MKNWCFEPTDKTFRNKNNESVITYEQYERLCGKYNNPTDELLDALEFIISLKK